MKNIKKSFLDAITETFKAYNQYGARSNKKLIPIHSWFAKVIENKLKKNYSVMSLGQKGEYKVDGKYYPKLLDISVLKKNKLISTISFKFVTSNYTAKNINIAINNKYLFKRHMFFADIPQHTKKYVLQDKQYSNNYFENLLGGFHYV